MLLTRGGAPITPPGPAVDEVQQRAEAAEAVRCELEDLLVQQAAAEVNQQHAQQERLQLEVEACCAAAEQQHQAIGRTLASLAAHLDCFSVRSADSGPPLLSMRLPDSYAAACGMLLDSLAGYVRHHFPGESNESNSGGVGLAGVNHQACQELEQLQTFASKAERLKVAEEAEIARCVIATGWNLTAWACRLLHARLLASSLTCSCACLL